MYLVHAALRPLSPGLHLPPDVRGLLWDAVRPTDRIEHLVVHRAAQPHPLLGVFVLTDSLLDAEERVAAFCRRAAAEPVLAGWSPARAAAPLVVPYYERLLSTPGGPGDAGVPGRNGPGTIPSSGEPFR
ncbi:hypothetical protein ABTZ03_19830 [Kitasatospora sp. NPDC096077]|uniref:hypothetical protein n=1 Tax=Kitasatospora sp. NPDC096077 TaxID=3155544 RepID=UPI00332AED66